MKPWKPFIIGVGISFLPLMIVAGPQDLMVPNIEDLDIPNIRSQLKEATTKGKRLEVLSQKVPQVEQLSMEDVDTLGLVISNPNLSDEDSRKMLKRFIPDKNLMTPGHGQPSVAPLSGAAVYTQTPNMMPPQKDEMKSILLQLVKELKTVKAELSALKKKVEELEGGN